MSRYRALWFAGVVNETGFPRELIGVVADYGYTEVVAPLSLVNARLMGSQTNGYWLTRWSVLYGSPQHTWLNDAYQCILDGLYQFNASYGLQETFGSDNFRMWLDLQLNSSDIQTDIQTILPSSDHTLHVTALVPLKEGDIVSLNIGATRDLQCIAPIRNTISFQCFRISDLIVS